MPRIIFYQPDRYTRLGADKADKYFEKNIPCEFHAVTEWNTFLTKLHDNYDLVAFHSDLFNDTAVEIIDFIKTIKTMLKFIGSEANVAVCINDKCTQEVIWQIHAAGASGIIPGRKEWDLKTSTTGFKECVSGNHWPEEIISALPTSTDNSIALFAPKYLPGIEITNKTAKLHRYYSLAYLTDALSTSPKYIFLHIDLFAGNVTAGDFMIMLDTIVSQNNADSSRPEYDRPTIVIKFTKETNVSRIKEFQKAGINYFVPASNSYEHDELEFAVREILSGAVEYYPKHLISKLPGNEKKKTNAIKVSLTNRQLEIFNLIAKRGLTNKQIARVLNITESTVKIHVSAIFKNLCVRNRTQLALTKI